MIHLFELGTFRIRTNALGRLHNAALRFNELNETKRPTMTRAWFIKNSVAVVFPQRDHHLRIVLAAAMHLQPFQTRQTQDIHEHNYRTCALHFDGFFFGR